MGVVTYKEASRLALVEEMRRDPTVWALGEDVGDGGVFGQYAGLRDEFGFNRVVSTPISEATIMGAAVGAAMVGTRPVVELRFAALEAPRVVFFERRLKRILTAYSVGSHIEVLIQYTKLKRCAILIVW